MRYFEVPSRIVHLTLSPSSTRRRMASERSSFTDWCPIHSSIVCNSYSVHCGFWLAARTFSVIPLAALTDAVILDSVLSFIEFSLSLPASLPDLSTGYAASCRSCRGLLQDG